MCNLDCDNCPLMEKDLDCDPFQNGGENKTVNWGEYPDHEF